MSRSFVLLMLLASLALLVVGTSPSAIAQNPSGQEEVVNEQITAQPAQPLAIFRPQGQVTSPASNFLPAADIGLRAHTNVEIFIPQGRPMVSANPDYTFAETPASIGCVYKVGTNFAGCNPTLGYKTHPAGGWGAIALVDAYDNPNAAADLAYFSSYWGLAAPKFTKVYANTGYGTLNGLTASCSGVPPANVGWGLEEALDIQWAHVMAPSAKIYLVEACSNSYNDLFFAEEVASNLVTAAGGGEISNSWGGGESASQLGITGYDNHFYREDVTGKPITYFASSGDYGYGMCGSACTGPSYPATNPWVVAVGGTTINRDAAGNYLSESCWSGSGGGYSAYEMWRDPDTYGNSIIFNSMGGWTPYQYPLFTGYPYTSAPRAMPDIAANADPASGVWVYDTYGYGGWVTIGGTSVSSPIIAGIVNAANNRLGMRATNGAYHTAELNLLYSQLLSYTAYKTNFYDVTTGSNGVSAGPKYDLCTGIGTPRGKLGK